MLSKQLHYEQGSGNYGIKMYSTTSEVGAPYLTLRIDGSLAYVQLVKVGEKGSSHVRVKKGTNIWALASSSQDPKMITDGGSVDNPSASAPTVTASSATYWGSGNNVAVSYGMQVTPNQLNDSSVVAVINVSWSKHINLTDTHHFRVKYGADTSCSSDAGTTTGTSLSFNYTNAPATVYIKVVAETSANVAQYESAVYALSMGYRLAQQITQKIKSADGAGASQVVRYSGAPTTASQSWSIDGAAAQRYYYISSTSTAGVDNYGSLACADTCTCNCNYCTCNCNYCTCNCNYCTCNCNYDPCGCSSN